MSHPQVRASWISKGGAALALLVAIVALPAIVFAQRDAAAVPPLPFRATVPEVARSSGSPASSQPGALVTITHTSVSNLNGDGSVTELTLWGDVHNGLDHPISAVTVTATATAADGTVLATGTTQPRLDIIPAGGDSPFSIPLPGATDLSTPVTAAIASYTDVAAAPAAAVLQTTIQPPVPFKIGQKDPKTGLWPDSPNLLAAYGAITNNGATTERIDSVAVAFEDAQGTVYLVGATSAFTANFPGTDPAVLAPGQAGSFTIYVPRAAWLALPAGVTMHLYVNTTPM